MTRLSRRTFVLSIIIGAGAFALAAYGIRSKPTEATQTMTTISSFSSHTTLSEQLYVDSIIERVEVPWALAFGPNNEFYFTERPGRIRLYQNGELFAFDVSYLGVIEQGESGLLGLALDPDFDENQLLYVYHTYSNETGMMNRVVRLKKDRDALTFDRIIVDRIPGAVIHDGGRIKFGPDRKLYVSTGDAANSPSAQDLNSLAGKFLRINADGSIPEDNPFPGSPVYSYGHRNPQGFDWHPETGELFSTEHGPSDNDEINIIEPGKNYGWPNVRGIANKPSYEDPILAFTPTIAPCGATFCTGKAFPEWRDNFLFTTLKAEHLHRLVLDKNTQIVTGQEILFQARFGRLRDIVEGPDGFLYLATSNRDGRGSPTDSDDKILRIKPLRE